MTSDGAPGSNYAEIIGDPVEHSLSPLIHRHWLGRLGIAADYRRTQVTRADLPAFVAARRNDPRWRGCNVTMPLKLDAVLLADEVLDGAAQAGACNTLVPRNGRLVAANTDIDAVETIVSRLAGDRRSDSVTLLGSGGAARAVLVALTRLGMRRVTVQARDGRKAELLASQFGLQLPPAPLASLVRTDALINATPLGMTGAPSLELDLSEMPADGWVFDLVTSPDPTALVVRATERGLRVSGGLPMLIEQAALAFPLFFGATPPRGAEADAILSARLAR